MALTSTTKGFWPKKNLTGPDLPVALEFILDDSETITIGDAVDLNAGFIQAVDAGDDVLGVVTGIVDSNGVPVNHPDADVDGTVTGDDTYVAASDNTTVKQVKVQVITSPYVLFYNDADGDLAQAQVGTFYDTTATGDQIDQSSTTTNGQFQLISIDPDGDGDASKGLFRISESQLYAYAQV